ncbi:MAG: recombinase family protein [Lachnospiraceae bacterium]|nr:recombinase family protein [Lachnospiraceae bacterium]
MSKITVIPAKPGRTFGNVSSSNKVTKRKVAGYARVSTGRDEQLTSYETQLAYYTEYITAHDEWEFAGMYSDEGISGTSIKKRKGFQAMVDDALAGKIDLIITKSVSRFARNTVDSLTTIRRLKDCGTEVYFEKENIWTFDGKGEVLLTIMSSLSQEESRSISQNVTWGVRKGFANGKVSVAYSNFLGYDKGPDGEWIINEKEAETIRLIFRLFQEGYHYKAICDRLNEKGILTPGGKKNWSINTIKGILSNEKYKGDARLQKKFTTDFLKKKMKKNEGEVPQYYVKGHHQPIIDPEEFDMVQAELERRKKYGYYSGVYIFSSKIKCAECGKWYGSKVWHSNNKYRKVVWMCNGRYKKKGERQCSTPHLTGDEIKAVFIKAMNVYLASRDEIRANLDEAVQVIEDTSDLERQLDDASAEMNIVDSMMQQAITENASDVVDQDEYDRKYKYLEDRYRKAQSEYDRLDAEIQDKKERAAEIRHLMDETDHIDGEVTEFKADMFGEFVDNITVRTKDDMTVVFKDGVEIKV